MANEKIKTELKQFILQHFHSVEEVEVLILLQKDRNREWNSGALSQALMSSTTSIEKRLADLCATGLIHCSNEGNSRFRYKPQTPAQEQLVEDLIKLWPELRLRVAQIIFEAPMERIRNFADAFKLKEDKEHG